MAVTRPDCPGARMLLAQRADASVKDNRLGMRIGVAKQKNIKNNKQQQPPRFLLFIVFIFQNRELFHFLLFGSQQSHSIPRIHRIHTWRASHQSWSPMTTNSYYIYIILHLFTQYFWSHWGIDVIDVNRSTNLFPSNWATYTIYTIYGLVAQVDSILLKTVTHFAGTLWMIKMP